MISRNVLELETNNAMSAIRLNKVYVCEATYETGDVFTPNLDKTKDLEYKFKCVFKPYNDCLLVQLGCLVSVVNTEKRIRLDTCGEFSVINDQNIDKETLKRILTRNTMSILFPYLRAYLSTFSSMTDLGAIEIPIFNVATILKNSEPKN